MFTSITSCGWASPGRFRMQVLSVLLLCSCRCCPWALEEFGTENATTPRTLLNSLREKRNNDDFESFGANVKVVAKQLCFCLTLQGLNFGVSIFNIMSVKSIILGNVEFPPSNMEWSTFMGLLLQGTAQEAWKDGPLTTHSCSHPFLGTAVLDDFLTTSCSWKLWRHVAGDWVGPMCCAWGIGVLWWRKWSGSQLCWSGRK